MSRARIAACTSLSLLSVLCLAATLLPAKSHTVPLVLPADGGAPNSSTRSPMLSANGRVAAMASEASNLVANDTDSVRDVLVVKLRKGTLACASVSSAGVKADADSDDPVLDRRGRHVAFASLATNLVAEDSNGVQDIFVHDLRKASTVRVSVASDGTQADGPSQQPWLSASGRYVVFASEATNLVPGDTNGVSDIFLHDLHASLTTRVSVAADGTQAEGGSLLPRLSGNGRWLTFLSLADNLVALDGNAKRDVFLRNLRTGAVEMVSVSSQELPATGHSDTVSLSANGRRVAFDSRAGNLDPADQHLGLDVFLRDRKKGTTQLVSRPLGDGPADGDSTQPALSGNGRWLAFASAASNLLPGDTNAATDVFRVKLKTGLIELVSVSTSGAQGNSTSDSPSLSRNGRYVAFSTRADNLFDGAATDGSWSAALARP